LNNITLSIREDEHIGLVGPNGCGKTTLIKLMLGILKPQKGEIYLKGRNIREYDLSEIGEMVGIVFQNPEKQLFCPTVWEQVSFSFRFQKDSNKIDELDDRLNYYLRLFDLEDKKDTSIYNLSGGEKQRLALASVLARKVGFVILDEPTTNLDISMVNQLNRYLSRLREGNIGYLIVSHDVGFLRENVKKIFALTPKGVEVVDNC